MNFDGASESRPALLAKAEHGSTQKPRHNPLKSRRFMSISARGHNLSTKPIKNLEIDDTTPMTLLSPRPTESEPWDKGQIKHSTSPFPLHKKSSTNEPQTAGDESTASKPEGYLSVTDNICLSPAPLAPKGEDRLEDQGHSPVAGDTHQSVQMQSRKDSATKSLLGIPFSPSRNAALTSHPV